MFSRYGAAPNAEQVKEFQTLCVKFFKDHPDDIIGNRGNVFIVTASLSLSK